MGYGETPINEIPTGELITKVQSELNNRTAAHEKGLCAYCGQPLNSHTCRYAATPFHDGKTYRITDEQPRTSSNCYQPRGYFGNSD